MEVLDARFHTPPQLIAAPILLRSKHSNLLPSHHYLQLQLAQMEHWKVVPWTLKQGHIEKCAYRSSDPALMAYIRSNIFPTGLLIWKSSITVVCGNHNF